MLVLCRQFADIKIALKKSGHKINFKKNAFLQID